MQINEECIRDILGYIIKNLDYEKKFDDKFSITSVSLNELYKDKEISTHYKEKDIMYSVLKLLEIHFIKVFKIIPPFHSCKNDLERV